MLPTSTVSSGSSLLFAADNPILEVKSSRPRALAGAEVYWTGATVSSGLSRNVNEALPRLHDVR